MTRNPLVAGLISVVAVLVFLFVFLLPKGAEVGQVEVEISSQEQVLFERQSELATLQALDPVALGAELSRLRTSLPPTADLPRLLRDLTVAAATANVDLLSITPGVPTPATAGAVSTMALSLSVQGTYFELAEFLFELENLDRLAKVSTISLSGGGEGGILSLQIAAEVYTTDLSSGPSSDPAPGPEVGA